MSLVAQTQAQFAMLPPVGRSSSSQPAEAWLRDAIAYSEKLLKEVARDDEKTLNSPEGQLLSARVQFLTRMLERLNRTAVGVPLGRGEVDQWFDKLALFVDLMMKEETKEDSLLEALAVETLVLHLDLAERDSNHKLKR